MAIEKVRLAEDAWNSRDPLRIALAYTVDSHWRNRAEYSRWIQHHAGFRLIQVSSE